MSCDFPNHDDRVLNEAGIPADLLERETLEDRREIVERLERICRADRDLGLAGDWAYDKARHGALYQLIVKERRELENLEAAQEQPDCVWRGAFTPFAENH